MLLLTRDLLQSLRQLTESEGMEKDSSSRSNQKAGRGCYTYISDRTDFKLKRDKEGHYIMKNGSIHQEDVTTN